MAAKTWEQLQAVAQEANRNGAEGTEVATSMDPLSWPVPEEAVTAIVSA